jgi:hypothetical protein
VWEAETVLTGEMASPFRDGASLRLMGLTLALLLGLIAMLYAGAAALVRRLRAPSHLSGDDTSVYAAPAPVLESDGDVWAVAMSWMQSTLALLVVWTIGLAVWWRAYGHLMRYLIKYLTVKRSIARFVRSGLTVSDLFERRVRDTPDATGLLFEQQTFTFRQIDQAANRYVCV